MARQLVDGDEIRRLRVEIRDLTMDQFLTALRLEGVERHEDTIRNIELGHTQPGDRLLNAIARVLDVRRDTLLLRETTP